MILSGRDGVTFGQGSTTGLDPQIFGLNLEPGAIEPGSGQTVTTMDADGKLVVARLHVKVGDQVVLMFPDGQLLARKRDEYSLCDRKFEPTSREALARHLTSSEFKGFKVKLTRHYVYVYNSSEEFWLGTKGILDSMVAGLIKHAKDHGIAACEPQVPLVVVMFASQTEFQKHRRMPPGVTAYYHTVSNRVYLYEPRELGELSRDLAVSQAISTIAHEGAHQILHNIGVQQRLSAWPMWLNEGLAEYFAPTSFGKNLTWKGAGRGNDLRMFELKNYQASRENEPADGRMIEQTVAAAQLTSAGYASAWALTHFLAKNHKAQFGGYLRQLSELGPLEGSGPSEGGSAVLSHLETFRKHFGQDLAEMETQLLAHLKKVPYKDPFAELPHFLAMIVIREGKEVRLRGELFHSSVQAEAWARAEIAKLPPELQPMAYHALRDFPNRAQAESYRTQWLKKG